MGRLLGFMKKGGLPLGPYRLNWSIERRSSVGRSNDQRRWGAGPYKLHLGPGSNWKKPDQNWITIDVDPSRADVVVDFNQGGTFPFLDNSVSCIYGSHVFEHMSIFVTPTVFRECYRVLCPGGVLRLVLPDARKSVEEYVAGNAGFPLFVRRRERAAQTWGISDYTLFECMREDYLSRSGQAGLLGKNMLAHQNAWDFETICRDLVRAGFAEGQVHRMGFRSSHATDFDWEGTFPSEANEDYRSLYVEAVKS